MEKPQLSSRSAILLQGSVALQSVAIVALLLLWPSTPQPQAAGVDSLVEQRLSEVIDGLSLLKQELHSGSETAERVGVEAALPSDNSKQLDEIADSIKELKAQIDSPTAIARDLSHLARSFHTANWSALSGLTVDYIKDPGETSRRHRFLTTIDVMRMFGNPSEVIGGDQAGASIWIYEKPGDEDSVVTFKFSSHGVYDLKATK